MADQYKGVEPGSSREHRAQVELDEINEKKSLVEQQLNRERLLRVTGDVIETITSPAFVEKMRQARVAADDGAGMDSAAKLLSIEGLREAGADIPADFRLTSRVFEDRVAGTRLEIKSDALRVTGGGLSWGGCAGAGGLTFCGCGGFST